MSLDGAGVLAWGALTGEILIATALVLAAFRLARGPSPLDRVMALDLIAVLSAGGILMHGIATDESAWVGVAVALALVGFLGTVFFARAVEQGSDPPGAQASESRVSWTRERESGGDGSG